MQIPETDNYSFMLYGLESIIYGHRLQFHYFINLMPLFQDNEENGPC